MLKEKKGMMFVLSSPSGAGKTTLAKKIAENNKNFTISISHTTRKPRPNEINGKDYNFVTEQEFNELVRSDTTWNRPTWPIGDHILGLSSKNEDIPLGPENLRKSNENFNDPFGFFTKDNNFRQPNEPEAENSLSIEEKKALILMGVDIPVKISELKARYKLLVKECHPDKTGGNIELEERFKQINQAYQKLMTKLTKN